MLVRNMILIWFFQHFDEVNNQSIPNFIGVNPVPLISFFAFSNSSLLYRSISSINFIYSDMLPFGPILNSSNFPDVFLPIIFMKYAPDNRAIVIFVIHKMVSLLSSFLL